MKLRVKVDGKEIYVEVLGDLEVRPYDGKYELLARVIDVSTVFPTQEKLLILTRGSDVFVKRVKDLLLLRKQISSHEEFEDVLTVATYVPPLGE